MIDFRKQLIIKDGLLKKNNFFIKNKEILTIDKVLKAPYYDSRFECVCITSDDTITKNIVVDRLVFNPYHHYINFINTRNIHESVVDRIGIREDDIIYLYPFGEDKILIIFDKKEN